MTSFNNAEEYAVYLKNLSYTDLKDIEDNLDREKHPDLLAVLSAEIESRRGEAEIELAKIRQSLKYRTFWLRLFAGVVDGGLLWTLGFGLRSAGRFGNVPAVSFIVEMVLAASGIVYSIWMHAKWGQTLGKMLLKVKVLDVSEKKLSLKQAVLRDIVPLIATLLFSPVFIHQALSGQTWIQMMSSTPALRFSVLVFSGIMNLWILVELVTMLTNSKRRAVHDFIARSVVVRIDGA